MERNVRWDFVRTILMLMVIALHSSRDSLNPYPLVWMTLLTVLFIANGGFFTISGYFMLGRELSTWQEYRSFYLKRIISILVPFFLYNLTIDLLFNRALYLNGFRGYMEIYIWNVLEYNSAGHLWFMYAYIPIAFCAPFFAKLLNHMKKTELLILAVVTGAFILAQELITLAGHSFVFNGFMILSWTLYFVMGHYMQRFYDEIQKWRYLFYALGLTGFLLVVLRSYAFQIIPGTILDAPYYVLFVFGFLVFLTHSVAVERVKWLSAVSKFLAKHSLTVYLTHVTMIQAVSQLLGKWPAYFRIPSGVLQNLVAFVFNVIFSILFAVLFDEIFLFRIQGLLRRLCRRWI